MMSSLSPKGENVSFKDIINIYNINMKNKDKLASR